MPRAFKTLRGIVYFQASVSAVILFLFYTAGQLSRRAEISAYIYSFPIISLSAMQISFKNVCKYIVILLHKGDIACTAFNVVL